MSLIDSLNVSHSSHVFSCSLHFTIYRTLRTEAHRRSSIEGDGFGPLLDLREQFNQTAEASTAADMLQWCWWLHFLYTSGCITVDESHVFPSFAEPLPALAWSDSPQPFFGIKEFRPMSLQPWSRLAALLSVRRPVSGPSLPRQHNILSAWITTGSRTTQCAQLHYSSNQRHEKIGSRGLFASEISCSS